VAMPPGPAEGKRASWLPAGPLAKSHEVRLGGSFGACHIDIFNNKLRQFLTLNTYRTF
jgi:hypothetical protein